MYQRFRSDTFYISNWLCNPVFTAIYLLTIMILLLWILGILSSGEGIQLLTFDLEPLQSQNIETVFFLISFCINTFKFMYFLFATGQDFPVLPRMIQKVLRVMPADITPIHCIHVCEISAAGVWLPCVR